MLRKIMPWTVFALIVGLLVFGAVNRTQAKTSQESSRADHLSGGTGRDAEGGQGQSRIPASGDRQADDQDQDWIAFSGSVSFFTADLLSLQLAPEGSLEISGRAWQYIQEQGYLPATGDLVEIRGFDENGEFQVSLIVDLTGGQTIPVRDETGRPLWSGGRGR